MSGIEIPDAVRNLPNFADNFKPGETYNIGGGHRHLIEELSDVVQKVTVASPSLVQCHDSKIFASRHKLVDAPEVIRDLGNQDTYSLEVDHRITAEWMLRVYNQLTHKSVDASFEA